MKSLNPPRISWKDAILLTALLPSLVLAHDDPNRPVAKAAALTPSQTAAQLTLPEGFRSELIAGEPQVVQPIAYTIDDKGRLWVVENTNYPECPGEAKDRVLVFEDTKGNGTFDHSTVFWDKATFTSGIAVGFGGVWLGAPPNLLYIPIADGDAPKPAGSPEIVLDGWGNQDTHETFNGFIWGPDGWLYGTQGVFTSSLVGKPGTPKSDRVAINAGVWRFHPLKGKFERWAEGGSNQWGIDWNDHGEAFFEACVIPHMWHAMEGARYQRQAGPHDNPYTYGDIQTIAWGRYEKAGYAGAMIYLGGAFPPIWRDRIFFNDIHMNKMRCESLERNGSGFKSIREKEFVFSQDAWYRGLSAQYGPDGGVFLNDWYDKVPCHQQKAYTDRTNGRIYKIVTDAVKPLKVDLSKESNSALVEAQLHPNDWYVRHARRILQERGASSDTTSALEAILFTNSDPTRQLRALWTLHGQQALSEATLLKALTAENESVRGWAVTLSLENGTPTTPLLERLLQLAQSDISPLVRRRVASAAQRLSSEASWNIVTKLASHPDSNDPNIPLLTWYAAESGIAEKPLRASELFSKSEIPLLQEYATRRLVALALEGNKAGTETLNSVLQQAAGSTAIGRAAVIRGLTSGLNGHTTFPEPGGWSVLYSAIRATGDEATRGQARRLGVIFGNAEALKELRIVLGASDTQENERRSAIEALATRKDPDAFDAIIKIATQKDGGKIALSAITALASYPGDRLAPKLIPAYETVGAAEKAAILQSLCQSREGSRALIAAIDASQIPLKDVGTSNARTIRGFQDTAMNSWLDTKWGAVNGNRAGFAEELVRYKKFLGDTAILRADAKRGKELFRGMCAICHTMFGTGGNIGPQLTGSYSDTDYLLHNILDPNAEIGKDFQQVFIETKDGSLRAGIVASEDSTSVTLKTLAGTVTIPLNEIRSRKVSPDSMMPTGLLGGLQEADVRNLFLYLRQAKELE
ncbi:MAG: PVC-type heme-binding CxxCH protein [Verrucomicrobiota bacterium]